MVRRPSVAELLVRLRTSMLRTNHRSRLSTTRLLLLVEAEPLFAEEEQLEVVRLMLPVAALNVAAVVASLPDEGMLNGEDEKVGETGKRYGYTICLK